MKRAILCGVGVLLFVLVLITSRAQAYPVTIYIEAEVYSVGDSGNYLEGKINVGDIITGCYTYESTTVDTNPLPDGADYWHYSAPYGIFLSAGGFSFSNDFSNVNFLVEILNDNQGLDAYVLHSYKNLNLLNGAIVEHISRQLSDSTGTALSSDALPLNAPVLSDWKFNHLRIIGEKSNFFGIDANVTSAIPEPSSILIISLGSLFLLRKKIKNLY